MVLLLKNVSLQRQGNKILNDVNWEVHKGEHWALLGLNGAGKSALLNMLCAYYFPTKGQITVLGQTFGKDPLGEELRQRIGLVSSVLKERIYQEDSAYQIVLSGAFASIGLYETPTDEMRDKARNLLIELGCLEYGNRSFLTLSQGERQRVMIARALMADPELLILDEPTNGLDFLAREQLLEAIERISQFTNPPTIIYVTHHVDEILPFLDHMLLLKAGSVFDAGLSSDLITSAKLSDFFEVPVEITWHNNRPILSKALEQ